MSLGAESGIFIETGIAALLFAVTFLAGNRVYPLRSVIRDRRSIVSFGSGMSAAYVFVHVMPELHGLRRSFAESVSMPLRYEGMSVYFLALIGFLTFYGLEHRRARLRRTAEAGQNGNTVTLTKNRATLGLKRFCQEKQARQASLV